MKSVNLFLSSKMADEVEDITTSNKSSMSELTLLESTSVSSAEQSYPEESPDPMRKRLKLKDEKICGVCGDKALGYNFNAITCESCKAFFRRNALKQKNMKCLFSGDCVIDTRTRRFCPYCRLKRCFQIGMKKDMILDDQEKKARMAKVLENRVKRQIPMNTMVIKEEPQDPEMPKVESSCIYSPPMEQDMDESSVDSKPSSASNLGKPFRPIPKEERSTDPSLYRRLTPSEAKLVDEVGNMYSTTVGSFIMMPEDVLKPDTYKSVTALVNHSEIAVRRIIKFVKRLEDFRRLSQEDQISALKASVLNALVIRSAFFYILDRDAWLTAKGEISTNILKQATGYFELHDSHIKYCHAMKNIMQDDSVLFALALIIALFNPNANGIKERQLMADIQDKYVILLKHYLESEMSYEHSREYFVAVLAKLNELRTISDDHAKVLLQVNPHSIEPLLLEIFNLK